ncbi:hypothetical protein [Phytohabitans aurantiacus]|uniref:hypothetical protein n=1 Tax=Phytohabitans aurantiacus TaxID=3016789 RepID=UPI002493AA27|nr:hypothetical protein [Phytohabitans aurantiacus]
MTLWADVEADLHQVYGVDVEDRALMKARSWRWLKTRILGLLTTDCRVYRALAPKAGDEPQDQ